MFLAVKEIFPDLDVERQEEVVEDDWFVTGEENGVLQGLGSQEK